MNARIALCAGGVLLCGTAAMIVVGPQRVAGQTDRPTAVQPRETETMRELRMLYAKDGKQMPEMNVRKMPLVTHSPGTQNLRPVDPKEDNSSSPLTYLKRLFSLGRKSSPPAASHPPQYRQPAAHAQYASQPRPVQPAATPPRYPAQPVRPLAQQRKSVPATTASNPRTFPAPKKSVEDDIPVLIDDRQPKQPATASAAARPFPKTTDDRPSLPALSPAGPVAKPVQQPGPFTGKSLNEDGPRPKVAASAVKQAPAAKPSAPGATLEIRSRQQLQTRQRTLSHPLAEPKILAKPGPAAKAVNSSAPAPSSASPSSREEKLRRIARRRGLAGFRGFCPVVLRDDRELADAKIQFQSQYRRKTYYLSSATAKATFDRAPEKYAPVSAGVDVVEFTDELKQEEGSLEHALWYRGRLYFFTGAESLRKFIADPSKYSSEE